MTEKDSYSSIEARITDTGKIYTKIQDTPSPEEDTGNINTTTDSANSRKNQVDKENAVNSQTQSKNLADKDYIDREFATLHGTLVVMPSERTMLAKIGQIISLEGFGKYLSGNYYIKGIRREINNSIGYSMEFEVVKTAFGGKLVKKEENSNSGEREKPKVVDKEV